MKQHFFRTPFAASGDKQNIPESADNDGFVSYKNGWGQDYELDILTEAHAKPVERTAMNSVLNAITAAIRQYQTDSFPEWITAADNSGTPYNYSKGAVVIYNNKIYISLVNSNHAVPGNDENMWQTFLYPRASVSEAIAGVNADVIITPPTLKGSIDHNLKEFNQQLSPYVLPVGAIILWGSPNPPDGWLELNGQAFNVADNPKLSQVFSSGHVPDYRGRFVRAWSNGSIIDHGRGIGTPQDEMIPRHQHVMAWGENHSAPGWGRTNYQGKVGSAKTDYDNWWFHTNDGSDWDGQVNPPGLVGHENRPVNIAAMYIVKTDQAEELEQGPTVPSAIVINPISVIMNAGTVREFTAYVLPLDLAGGYPVTWSVGDSKLGSISQEGVYTANKNTSGSQTIIASISTGLTELAAVTQFIYLTKLTMSAIPGLTEGDTHNIGITATPSNYTEGLNYSSSDDQIASVGNGVITAISPGTVTITATGPQSGITVSRQVKITAAIVVEKYLQVRENLADIDDASKARKNLGLGQLATKNSLTATDVNAFPQTDKSLPLDADLNAVTAAGAYYQSLSSSATEKLNYPVGIAGALLVYYTGPGIKQEYLPYNSADRYVRSAYGNPLVFSPWNNDSGSDDPPAGIPQPWPGATPPHGWLKCNGSAFNKTLYPKLATAYPTGKLPDLRGEFIRGWDDGRGVDAERGLLSEQLDELRRHAHEAFSNTQDPGLSKTAGGDGSHWYLDVKFNTYDLYGKVTTRGFGGAETRPRNIAFNYIVRAA